MNLHRFLDTPLGITERRAATMLHEVRLKFAEWSALDFGETERPKTEAKAMVRGNGKTFELLQGVAIVPVSGVLVHGSTSMWDETDYGSLATQFVDAIEDSDVRGVALQIASPGGEVSGLFELIDTIADKKTEKPVWAILDDHAYSAAYAIASAADKVTVPRAGGVGSIGVITMHLDVSKLLEEMGVNVSLITYGDRKADLSPFRPLSDGAKGRLQADVNSVGEMFVEMVSKNRRMSRTKVRSTEAGMFMGASGVEAGFADAVMSPQEAFSALVAKVN